MRSHALPKWSVLSGSSVLCTGTSLAGLAHKYERPPTDDAQSVIQRLSLIRPLQAPNDSPWMQLHHCRMRAREVLDHPEIGLPSDAACDLVSIYEAALSAGFDDLFYCVPEGVGELFGCDVPEHAAALGWRHGAAIREWWASYARLVDVLLGKGQFMSETPEADSPETCDRLKCRDSVTPSSHQRAFLLARRLRHFSQSIIVLTVFLGGALFALELTAIAAHLFVLWIAGAVILFALTKLFGEAQERQSQSRRLRPIGALTCIAIAGVAAVAGSFFLVGVPYAGGLVFAAAVISVTLVLLAGAQ